MGRNPGGRGLSLDQRFHFHSCGENAARQRVAVLAVLLVLLVLLDRKKTPVVVPVVVVVVVVVIMVGVLQPPWE